MARTHRLKAGERSDSALREASEPRVLEAALGALSALHWDLAANATVVPFEAFGHSAFARRFSDTAIKLSQTPPPNPKPALPNETLYGLHAAGALGWPRAVIDSSHVRAMKGGPKRARARLTVPGPARSTT